MNEGPSSNLDLILHNLAINFTTSILKQIFGIIVYNPTSKIATNIYDIISLLLHSPTHQSKILPLHLHSFASSRLVLEIPLL